MPEYVGCHICTGYVPPEQRTPHALVFHGSCYAQALRTTPRHRTAEEQLVVFVGEMWLAATDYINAFHDVLWRWYQVGCKPALPIRAWRESDGNADARPINVAPGRDAITDLMTIKFRTFGKGRK